ncbi:MAG: hypothetical protein C0515_05415 [Novosphingobium sp.]|nr:hypothetical protein [Novosphingobium sp.]
MGRRQGNLRGAGAGVGEVRLIILACLAAATFAASAPGGVRTVNVTQGSEPGWIPSPELEGEARDVVARYSKALDSGKYEEARTLQGSGLKELLPAEQFRSDSKRSRKENGALLALDIRMITWTKDSPSAPSPGIYAAVDLVNKYALTSRHCGFIILYKRQEGEPFKVVRSENTFMSNKTAKAIGANAPNVWRNVSAVCPGFTPPP